MYTCALIEGDRGNVGDSERLYRAAAERGFMPAIYDLGAILHRRGDPESARWTALWQLVGYEPWEDFVLGGDE